MQYSNVKISQSDIHIQGKRKNILLYIKIFNKVWYIEYRSGRYSIYNIEYQYGRDSKFKLKNETFEKFEYQISI